MASWSKKLNTSQQNYSATDKEWLAVVESVSRVWRHWLLGKEFTIRTDHAALKEILTKKGEDFTPRQLRWWERLEPYSFTVEYIKGNENVVPDALSRTPVFYVNALELTPQEGWIVGSQDLREASLKDPKYQEVLQSHDILTKLELVAREGLIVTPLGQVCVPHNVVLRYKLMLEAHEPPFAGHFCVDKILAHAKRYWWWPRMRETAEKVVKGCPLCQSNATKKCKDQGALWPILASAPWEVVTVDFVSGFAPSVRTRHTACCVVSDRFIRMIHIEPCRDHATARETVGLILRMVVARHGCPRVILSDKRTQFDSELWREVWQMLGTRVAMATTHHPQTNGLTERMNRTLISLIRKYVHEYPKRWAEFLPLFEFAYNAQVHSSTKVAPFEAQNGVLPPMPAQLLTTPRTLSEPNNSVVASHVMDLRKAMDRIHGMVTQNTQKANQDMETRESKKRGNPRLHVGDEVLVYWPPFRAYSDEARKHRLRYVGPYRVKKVVGPSVVELEGLPAKMPSAINVEYLHPYTRDADDRLTALRTSPAPPRPGQ